MSYIPNPLIIPVGIAVGIVVSAPVGPVNVMCIQRSVQRGIAGGVAAGLGAVFGDGLIAFAAVMGIGAIDAMVTYYRTAIEALGGIALLVFGVLLCNADVPATDQDQPDEPGHVLNYIGDISKAFFLTVTNPGAVLGLLAIFGGIGTFVEVSGPIDAIVLVAAIMGGSLLWWLMLSTIVATIKQHVGKVNVKRFNLIAGLALTLFGVVLLSEVAWKLGGREIFLNFCRTVNLI
jgi:threonine/homoserine/homoserine lactone efflux protein